MAAGKKILFINRRGPFGSIYDQEALEIALIGAAFEQQISLALIDDSVFLLRRGQNSDEDAVYAALSGTRFPTAHARCARAARRIRAESRC